MKSLFGTVKEVQVAKRGRMYVKVLHGGNAVGSELDNDKQEETIDVNQLKYKVIKSSQLAPSSLKTTENYSALIGSPKNRIVSSENYGNFMIGPTTFTAHPENIRIGGVYRFNGHITSTMPSTIVTPVPTLKFDYPLEDTLKGMGELLTDYQTFLAGIL